MWIAIFYHFEKRYLSFNKVTTIKYNFIEQILNKVLRLITFKNYGLENIIMLHFNTIIIIGGSMFIESNKNK